MVSLPSEELTLPHEVQGDESELINLQETSTLIKV
jgi:hypothetical protein